MRLVLVGPPGAGKGTQAEFIAAHFDIPKISTGDIFRANVSGGTELGRQAKKYMDAGDLVPTRSPTRWCATGWPSPTPPTGFLLDGFPRNVAAGRRAQRHPGRARRALSVVLDLDVDHDEVVKRLSGRRTCKKCGHVWHLEFDPPSEAGICDKCGGELYQRDDDQPETVRHRLEVYADADRAADRVLPPSRTSSSPSMPLGAVEDVTERAIERADPVRRP